MGLGTLQQVIVCVPATTGATAAPCQTVAGVRYRPAMKSVYVIDPANSEYLDMAIEPLDRASVVTVFTLAFSVVMLCFLLGRGVGVVLSLIRRG